MSIPLNYGYIKPTTGDKGSVWFPALETNITLLAAHNHDGATAAKIVGTNILTVKQSILAANWTDPTNGIYYQELELPNQANYSDVFIMIKDSTGNQLFLEVKPGSTAKKYKVYCNDASLVATAYILV